jgi:hypothetical protein
MLNAMYTGTEQPLYDAFGIPNMHLSYGVVEQTVSGVADTRYIMQAQLSLGVACSPYQLQLSPAGRMGAAYSAAVTGVDAGYASVMCVCVCVCVCACVCVCVCVCACVCVCVY